METSRTEPVFLERYGQPAAVLISPERYEELKEALEALEALEDVVAFDAAMAEEGANIPCYIVSLLGVNPYRIELRPAAARALRKLDPEARQRVVGGIALLAHIPRPPASRALRGRPGFRVPAGGYHILYAVANDVLLVVVVALGHGGDVYDRAGCRPGGPAAQDAGRAFPYR